MNYRISFGLVLLLGCAVESPDLTDATSGSQTVASTQLTTDPSDSAPATDTNTTLADTATTGDTSTSTGACMPMVGGPAPLVLGGDDDLAAPGAYLVLAKTAISNVPGSSFAGGHLGVSPASSTAITGFTLVLDPSGVFATAPEVAGPARLYAADYAVPTPVNLTTAVLAMQAAYTDAAGRVPVDHLELGSGDIGGLTLAPGVYQWGGTVLIPQDVTLEGCEDDVWIFQIAGDLDVATDRTITLAGGAQARNVFWQVAGTATVHANAHFAGTLLSKTSITLQTGASLHGRALAQTLVAFDHNAVTTP